MNDQPSSKKKQKKISAKILRYFPLNPRLQRLFLCCKIAEHMRWHAQDSNSDGIMRHPWYGEAWKKFDTIFLEFSIDPRHVCLGLDRDGFNPFVMMSTTYNIWPVVLISYNLPPWMCKNHPNLILSMIIPGPHMVGNNMDIYLQPLVKELNKLWCEGLETIDSSKNEMFRMWVSLMWTISGFSGLDILSGWNTHTGYACHSWNLDT